MDEKERKEARQLGAEGLRLFAQRRYEEALDRFERAEALVPAPTLGLRAARCLVKLDRYVEASRRYQQVIKQKLATGAPWIHRVAKQQAEMEYKKLQPKIPKLIISVSGPVGEGVEISIDGRPLPSSSLDLEVPIDPGRRQVTVEREDDGVIVQHSVEATEGQTATVELELPPIRERPPSDAEPWGGGQADNEQDEPDPDKLATYQAIGIGALAVGGAGLLMGAIAGGVAVGQQSDLEERCPERVCPPEAHGDADGYDASRATATVGFVIAGVGAAAGVTLLLLAPELARDGEGPDEPLEPVEDDEEVAIRPWIGWGVAGLSGEF